MKKVILFFVILLSLASTRSNAQQNMGQMQEQWKSYLKDSVKLGDAMVDSVMAVRMQYRPQMREIFMDQSSSAEDKDAKLKTLRSEMDVRYKSAGITDEQIQAIHQHEDYMRAQMMKNMNGGGQ
jgi:hypothetical protein